MHPFLEGSKFAAFAHRGGALEVPENTLEAFEHAIGLGYRYIETDVQLTADGVVVIFHDDDLERLTGRKGRVSDHTWAELSDARIHGKGGIPRLEDALTAWPSLHLNIDAKTDDVAAPLCKVVQSGNPGRLCLASESDKRINFIREEMGASLCTGAASWETARFMLPALLGLKPGKIDAHCLQVPVKAYGLPVTSARQVARAEEAGKAVHVWTIDDEVEIERLIGLGVHGIMTDRPSLLREVLKRRNLWD